MRRRVTKDHANRNES